MKASTKREGREVIELLIEEGADMNARDNEGNTVLMKACYKFHLEMIRQCEK